MSFKFTFDLDEMDELEDSLNELVNLSLLDSTPLSPPLPPAAPSQELSLAQLIKSLPPLISYTPVVVPLSNSFKGSNIRERIILRRDLFDARFQVLAQDSNPDRMNDNLFIPQSEEEEKEEEGKGREGFINEESDLVKGIYEGGLKTWECSLDLIDCLENFGYGIPPHSSEVIEEKVRGKSILELGCGTALPSCAIFARLLEEIARSPTDSRSGVLPPLTRIHLQDYNESVLGLMTLPNLLLTYAQHLTGGGIAGTEKVPKTTTMILSEGELGTIAEDEDDSMHPSPNASSAPNEAEGESESESDDAARPGELEITPEFLESFETLLRDENIEFLFFTGDWSTLIPPAPNYHLLLSSETIYSLDSLPALLDLLKRVGKLNGAMESFIACKRIYFGVGGGEVEFKRRVGELGGWVGDVWGEGTGVGRNEGVGRVVMRVHWD